MNAGQAVFVGCVLAAAYYIWAGMPPLFRLPPARPALAGVAGAATAGPGPGAPGGDYLVGTHPTAVPFAGGPGQAELWPGATPCGGWHAGAIDWCAPLGTEVRAPMACTFLMRGEYHDDPRYGAYIMCTTASGLEVYIGHMDMATVNPLGFGPGSRIEAGQTLGYIGPHFITTHVHVQFRRGGALVPDGSWWAEWDNR